MDVKRVLVAIADKLGIVRALLKTSSMAAENKEHFVEDGQNIAIVLEMAITELRECRKILEASLESYHCGPDGGGRPGDCI